VRAREIRDLDRALKAVDTLEDLSHAMNWSAIAVQPRSRPTHYLIRYDSVSKIVDVQPYTMPIKAAESYDKAEAVTIGADNEAENIVLVEVDKIENLKIAYPNYFGDVQIFKSQLKAITKGKAASEYAVQPQQIVPPQPRERPDLSWLRRRGRWK
jgi:hypothetical protein